VKSVRVAASDAEAVVLATPWGKTREAIDAAGDLAGKIVIDCTNPLGMTPSGLALTMGFDHSAGEEVAGWAKGAFVVKCFNQTGFGNMEKPELKGIRSMMFVCGEDAKSRETVRKLAEQIGFDAIDAGGIAVSRLLEPLAMLWIHLAYTTPLGRDFAFAVIRR
jgi:predicted dinucleotide-binding enzyme